MSESTRPVTERTGAGKAQAPLLEMRDITKIFPGVVALSHVNLTIHQGEIHLLLGENGAGKSTMIKTIIGINKPEGGEMFWLGRPAKLHSIQDAYDLGIAVIYQELSNIPCLSVVENMYLGFEKRKGGLIDWKEPRDAAPEKRWSVSGWPILMWTPRWRSSVWASGSSWRSPVRSTATPSCSSWTSRPHRSAARRLISCST